MACVKLLAKAFLDVFSLVLVTLPTVLLIVYAKPVRRGFYCRDESIEYPYMNDSVTGKALMTGTFSIPAIVILFVELLRFLAKRKSQYYLPPRRIAGSCSVPAIFPKLYKAFGIFVFGFAVQLTITFIGKYSTGRLRPHFLSVCRPNFSAINCTATNDLPAYVTEEVCTRAYDYKMIDARLSFPSGHASIAAYIAVFLVLYLQKRMTWDFSRLLRPCLQSILLFVAIYVGLSRVTDNKHHWSDVLAGSVCGSLSGVFSVLGIWKKPRNNGMKRDSQLLQVQAADVGPSFKDTRI